MPLYDYHCEAHGTVSAIRRIDERDQQLNCPRCGVPSARVIAAPRLQTMSAINRTAWERNERSAHEPIRHRHSACGHHHAAGQSCGSDTRNATDPKPALMTGSAGSRPWMLGH